MHVPTSTENKLFTAGTIAKGVVYVLLGFFTVATVIGAGSGPQGPKGVIQWIGTNPFGQILLFLIGIGLLCYGLWRWYTVIYDPMRNEDDKKEIGKRIGFAASGTSYMILSFYAFKLLFGSGGGGGSSKQDAIQWLLSQSWGQFAVGAIGVAMAIGGFFQLYKAIKDKHMENIERNGLSKEERETYKQTGRIGFVARFLVFGVIAYFLFKAALMNNPDQFKGMSEAINQLGEFPFGTALVAITGAGLLAHGLFMFARAKFETQ